MTISTGIPESWNLPLFWATVDGSFAGNVSTAQRALLTGQMFTSGLNAGNAVMNVPIPIGSVAQAGQSFGVGSMLYRMCVAFFADNSTQQLWCLPVPDGAGTAATGALIVTSGFNSGVVNLYIAGQLVQCAVGSTDSASTIAANLVAAINALTSLPVVATQPAGTTIAASAPTTTSSPTLTFASGGAAAKPGMTAFDATTGVYLGLVLSSTATTVTLTANSKGAVASADSIVFASPMVSLTCQWAGLTGNDVIIMSNYRGVAGGEFYPTGMSILFSQLLIPTSATGSTGQAALTFASGADVNVVAGMVAYDNTVSTTTLLGTVLSTTATTVTLTANLLNAVGSGDNIAFYSTNFGQLTGGTGSPNMATAIANIQLLSFLYVGMPYSDGGSLAAWAAEYGFGQNGRWSYTRQQYGMVCNARRDSYANLLTWGLTQNVPVISTMEMEPKLPSPPWEMAAAYAANAALGFTDDPARPLQTLELGAGTLLPPLVQDRFLQTQRNNLVNSGLAVQGVDAAGNLMILVEQSQYQFNSFGQSDTAYGKLTVLATLQTLLDRMRTSITNKYPRVKLIPDGTRIGPGQAAVTPTDIKGELIAEYVNAEFDGLVSNLQAFSNNLLVQIDNNNPNKVQVLWAPQLAGQLRQFDVLAQFRLQYPN